MPSNDAEEESPDVISSILTGSAFKIRPEVEKLRIITNGRPTPKLCITKRDSNKNSNRTFQTNWYDIHKWLCGSKSYNKLFCWPCTLMRPETSSWCSTGNDDIKRFTSLAAKHALCKSHLKAITEYNELLTSLGLAPEYENEANLKCKEEGTSPENSEEDDEIVGLFKKNDLKNKKSNSDQTTLNESSTKISNETTQLSDSSKLTTKITFKNWLDMNKDLVNVNNSKVFDYAKLFKCRRKLARQELRNARLTGEKLKFEIEALKTKVDYYKSLKEETVSKAVNKAEVVDSHSSNMIIQIEKEHGD